MDADFTSVENNQKKPCCFAVAEKWGGGTLPNNQLYGSTLC